MFDFTCDRRPGRSRGCSRRNFLRVGGLTTLGLSLPSLLAAEAKAAPQGRAKSVLLVFLGGGLSHHDSFDPKPDAMEEIRGKYQTIETNVPGLRIGELLPKMARTMDRVCLVRSGSHNNDHHETATNWVLSGRFGTPFGDWPAMGAVAAHEFGFEGSLPPYVAIPRNPSFTWELGKSAFLGGRCESFKVGDPNDANFRVRDLFAPEPLSDVRLQRRRSFLETVDQLARRVEGSDAIDSYDQYQQRATAMVLSPQAREAFAIERESEELRDRYGRNTFGQSCLMARRLIEAGVRFATVNYAGWDHHAKIFEGLDNKLPEFDMGFSALIEDMQQRGLLEDTLVVCMGEFGRTPKINKDAGRDHWGPVASMLFAGAGVQPGRVIGASDKEGGFVIWPVLAERLWPRQPDRQTVRAGRRLVHDLGCAWYRSSQTPLHRRWTTRGNPRQWSPHGGAVLLMSGILSSAFRARVLLPAGGFPPSAVGFAVLIPVLLWLPAATAEDAPQPPEVRLCAPLGGVPGQTVDVTARGLRLEGTTEVISHTEGITAEFLSHAKAGLPPQLQAERVGDTQVLFRLTLPAATTAEVVALEFVAPHGRTTYRLPLQASGPLVQETEPNPGFEQPQEIAVPQTVLGRIEEAQDVDVYAVQLAAGQSIRIEVAAEPYGSALDGRVMLLDGNGTPLATSDDQPSTRDPRLDAVVPTSSRYFIVIQDANDLGGAAHPYRLSVATLPPPVSFVRQIAPILLERCVGCHGAETAEGGYRLDTFAYLQAAGNSGGAGFIPHELDGSESFRRITSEDPAERMPLDSEPLADEEIAAIRQWVQEGARFDGEDPKAPLATQLPEVIHPQAPAVYPAPLPLTALAFSIAGDELWVGGYHEITVWHPSEGTLLRRIGQVAERTYAIAAHPSGEQFAVACGTPGQLGEVRIFNRSGELQSVFAGSTDVLHDLAYSPAGDRLAVAGCETGIRVYDTERGELQLEITNHLDWVLAVAWSPDGSMIASGSRDKTAKVSSAATGQLLASYARHDAPVRGVLFHPSGDEVYSSGENDRWERWKLADSERVRDMHLGDVGYKLVSAGEHFIVPSANNRVHLMNASESDRVRELNATEEARFLSATAHPATDRVAAGTDRGTVVVWELSTGKQLAAFQAYPGAPPQ